MMLRMAADPLLATRIKRARERMRWSQQELADRIGVNRKTVDNWENGRNSPRSSLGALEAVLGSLSEEDSEVLRDDRERELWALATFTEDERREFIRAYRERQRQERRAG
jgi:transcriptional regulator with XRE-family HTH domain